MLISVNCMPFFHERKRILIPSKIKGKGKNLLPD
jgi:hypothetical protein